MKEKSKSKVLVEVHRIALRKWFEDSSLTNYTFLREMIFDHEMSPLDLFLEQDEVFLIRYYEKNTEDNNSPVNEPRSFITDGEHVIDFTLVEFVTDLEGCQTEKVHNYPQEINDIITEYCFGHGFDKFTLKEKLKEYMDIISIPPFNEEVKNILREHILNKAYIRITKGLLFFSSYENIYDQLDKGGLINLDEIYRQFGQPEDMNPLKIVSTPFFKLVNDFVMISTNLPLKKLQQKRKGQIYVHAIIATYYLIIICEDIVLDKSLWKKIIKEYKSQSEIEILSLSMEVDIELLKAFHRISDSNYHNNN